MTAPVLHDYPADAVVVLVQLIGADAIERLGRSATDEELDLVNGRLACHNGDPVAALGVIADSAVAARIRALPIGVRS